MGPVTRSLAVSKNRYVRLASCATADHSLDLHNELPGPSALIGFVRLEIEFCLRDLIVPTRAGTI